MKTLLVLLLTFVMAGCGQATIDLPEGVTCNDEAFATIRENPPDERADPASAEYTEFYAFSYFRSVGCETPEPSFVPLDQ